MTLPTRLPPWPGGEQWTRTAWSSQRAKDVWAPRISKINSVLELLEVESVFQGLRPSAMIFRPPEDLPRLTERALAHRCAAHVLNIEGVVSTYAAAGVPHTPGQPFKFRIAVTTKIKAWRAYAQGNEDAIGYLLGFPSCCTGFYKKYWVEEAWRDTTLPMSENGTEGSPFGNILLRWSGVRFVQHLPCSHSCQETERIGRRVYQLGCDLGYQDEMDWALEMLSWPVEWSSLHGIAEITTPVFKISTSSDPLSKKAVVQKEGTKYPEEGATGLKFPFKQLSTRKVTDSRSFKTSIVLPPWAMNGFSSYEAMVRAHDIVVDAIPEDLSQKVLDLGCGNGELLKRICGRSNLFQPYGIEIDRERLKGAFENLHWGHFTLGDISDVSLWPDQYGLVLLMPGRLLEMKPEVRARFLEHLYSHTKQLVVYAYDDSIKQLGGLIHFCSMNGLDVPVKFRRVEDHAEAALLVWQ